MSPSPTPPARRTPAVVSDVVAFALFAALLFGISWLRTLLREVQPFGLAPEAAPYVAYAIGYGLVGVAVGWRAARLERLPSDPPLDRRVLYATCILGCVLVGIFFAWLLG